MKNEFHVVDLTRMRGKGRFKCPKCGIWISPDDKTEDTFTILELIMKENTLQKVILQCGKCQSEIHLTGFELLKEIDHS